MGWEGEQHMKGGMFVIPPNTNVKGHVKHPPSILSMFTYGDGTSTMDNDKRKISTMSA